MWSDYTKINTNQNTTRYLKNVFFSVFFFFQVDLLVRMHGNMGASLPPVSVLHRPTWLEWRDVTLQWVCCFSRKPKACSSDIVINLSYLEVTSTFKENGHHHFCSFILLLKYFAGLNQINVWVRLLIYLSWWGESCMTPLTAPSLTPTWSLCGSRFAKTDSSLAAALGYSFPNSL